MRHGSMRVFAGSLALASAVMAAGQSPAFYSYFKKQIPLTLNDTVVALYKSPELGVPQLPSQIAPNAELKPGYIAGWYFLEVPGGGTEQRISAWSEVADSTVLPVFRDKFGAPLVFSNVLHVRFNEGVSSDQCEAVLRALPQRSFSRMALSNTYKVQLNEKDGYRILDIANTLAARSDVRFASPNSLITGRKDFVPNDPYFPRQWGLGANGGYPTGWGPLRHINVVNAWNITTGNPAVKIAVLDDGIQLNHPDIPIANAKDFILQTGTGGPAVPQDVHGTIMAGLIGASINNGKGIAGVAGNCGLVSVRVHRSTGLTGTFATTPEAVSNGLIWAMGENCRVSNNSNSYGASDALIDDTYFAAWQSGMVNFAAAGNTGTAGVTYPADLDWVAAISATLPNAGKSPDSATGEEVFLSAPGSFTITTDRTGTDGYPPGFFPAILSSDQNYVLFDGIFSGTSFASAYASGVAGLVLSVNPTLSPSQVLNVMAGTATDIVIDAADANSPDLTGRDDRFGFGLINAARALSNFLLQDLSANPNPVKGGLKTKATVRLSIDTTEDLGYVIRSDNESVIPADKPITIPAGANNGSVDLETNGVDVATDVPLHVDAINLRRTVVVTVIPATLNRLALNKTEVYGGETFYGQVELAGRAGPSGSVIIITDDSDAVNPPTSVRVPAQQTKVVFAIPTSRTSTTHVATVRARQGTIIFNKSITIKGVSTDIATFALSPTTVSGGAKSFGTINLTNPAPVGGAQIDFSDNSTVTSFVNNITIAESDSSGTVQVNTGPIGTTSQSTIRATYLGVSKTAILTITPTLWVTSLTVTPSVVRGGFPAVGRIQIYSLAPAGGVPVAVTDTNSYVSTPLVVTVPQGRNWVEFPITTYPTQITRYGDVRASYGGVTKVAPITVYK